MLPGLDLALVGGSWRASRGLTRVLTATPARAVATGAAASAAAIRSATAVLTPETRDSRRVWSARGRAQVEVRGLAGPDCAAVVAEVETALAALGGVSWARVDAVTRRVTVRHHPDQLAVADLTATVAAAETAAGAGAERYPAADPSFPGDPQPVVQQALGLAADVVGLTAAVSGQLLRLPRLPGGTPAAVALVDTQPRLRQLLESRLGPAGTDLTLAVSNAAVQGLSQGVPSLLVDTGQRAQALLAARARRAAYAAGEADLAGPHRPVRAMPLATGPRPVPLPAGPVERLADRAGAGSLLAAGGLLAGTGNPNLAGEAILIGAPRAARAAREAFADTLGIGLARRGTLVVDDGALRRLDRVTTLLIDSAVLHDDRPVVIDAQPVVTDWTREHVWSAAQRLCWGGAQLPVPPPPGRHRHRLALTPAPPAATAAPAGLTRQLLTEDGRVVGEVLVGKEIDPYADAVLAAARAAGLRLTLTDDPAGGELAARADDIVATADPTSHVAGETGLTQQVRRLQADGQVVAVLGTDEEALAAADVGLGVIASTGRVPWAADLLCGGLGEVPRLLAALPAARRISQRGVTLAVGATFLGGLLVAVGGPGRGGRAVLPVTAAAGSGLLSGTFAAVQVIRSPDPDPVHHTPWHALEPDEVTARLAGLVNTAAAAGTPAGWTRLAVDRPRAPLAAVAGHTGLAGLVSNVRAEFADPLTPVLATGAAASAVIGSPTDALLVGGVLVANALISGGQRLRADRALRALLADQQLPARRRVEETDPDAGGAGGVAVVPASGLRTGDVIELRTGDVVPADGRVLSVADLEVDEASLTGESVAVGKQTQATPGAELADRACMVYEGTTVLAGTARVVVVAVGPATEAGRALALAGRAAGPAGMQARLEELTRRGLPVTLLGGAAVTGLALLRGRPLPAALRSGVAVAVAAVPEGLPLVATVAQFGAARRLSARGVLVRSSRTLEALGRVDTVCFDKTGTLTEGRLRLVRVAGLDADWAPDAPPARRVLRAAARACPRPGDGQPLAHATDRAVLQAAAAVLGAELAEGWEELVELPFHSDRGFSAAVGRAGDATRLVVKGAPEVLLPRCSHERDDTGKRPLDRAGRDRATATVHTLAARGLRVLAVARRNVGDAVADGQQTLDPAELAGDLTLLGFLALADVARPEAAPTIADLHRVGLTTVMITGDHPVTARAIAVGLGIPAEVVVTGPQLAGRTEQARTELIARASVFARVSPEQKLQIIAGLQAAGRVVAMTGDGANDAAAIRLADVGIGMAARGSVAARSAADLVLTNPDVSLLLDALVEGRAMWRRVRDAVAILIGGNAGEVAFTLAGTALAGRAPIGTRQFLLVNMLTDLLPAMAIALAATPTDPAERQRLLAAGAPSLGAPLLHDIAVRGAATGAGALVAWQIGRVTGTRRRASTMALAALVGTQLGQTLLVGGRNPLVLATGIGSAAALTGIIEIPGVSQFFGCTPLDPLAWAVVVGASAAGTAGAALLPRLLPAPPPDPTSA